MKPQKKILSVFIATAFLFPMVNNAQQKQEEQHAKIPKVVANLMEGNLPTRNAKLDIPLSYVQTLYFPYQNDYFSIFIFKIKNQDLNYASPLQTVEQKQETEQNVSQEEQSLTCAADFFFRFYSVGDNGQVKSIHKEIYLPYSDQVDPKEYNPEEENIYAFGTIFPPGRYLLSAAAVSLNSAKIGLIFQDIYLPSSLEFKKSLGLTPLFFVKNMKRIPAPDSSIILYKNRFHYATLEIEPYFEHEFSQNEKLDIFYFILGLAPTEEGTFKFEVSYTYKKDNEDILKFEPRMETIPAPIVSVPLDLSFQDKKIDPGVYILEISIKDQTSKREGIKNIDFIVK